MNNIPVYDTEQLITQKGIQYFFESNGVKSIIKAIDYSPIDFKMEKRSTISVLVIMMNKMTSLLMMLIVITAITILF